MSSKKNFSDNPALNYITSKPEPSQAQQQAVAVQSTIATANAFSAPVPEGYRLNPMYIERKTKRVQLLFQPSLYERAKRAAEANGISLNEFAHQAFEKMLEDMEK